MSGGKSGGSSSGNSTTTVFYAPYIENAHAELISDSIQLVHDLIWAYPYANITAGPAVDLMFFGGIAPPSSLQLFNNYVVNQNPEVMAVDVYGDMIEAQGQPYIKAEADLLDNELTMRILPRLKAGARDINAVMSSGFITIQAQLEAEKLLAINKFATDFKWKMVDFAMQLTRLKLDWNLKTLEAWNAVHRDYWSAKMKQIDKQNELNTANILWPFTVLDHSRAIVAAMSGSYSSNVKGQGQEKKSGISFDVKENLGALSAIAALLL